MIERYFLEKRVDETRCPEKIRALGVEGEFVYLLRERIECNDWKKVSKYFKNVRGKYIVNTPLAGRSYFTVEPEKVISIMKREGPW